MDDKDPMRETLGRRVCVRVHVHSTEPSTSNCTLASDVFWTDLRVVIEGEEVMVFMEVASTEL